MLPTDSIQPPLGSSMTLPGGSSGQPRLRFRSVGMASHIPLSLLGLFIRHDLYPLPHDSSKRNPHHRLQIPLRLNPMALRPRKQRRRRRRKDLNSPRELRKQHKSICEPNWPRMVPQAKILDFRRFGDYSRLRDPKPKHLVSHSSSYWYPRLSPCQSHSPLEKSWMELPRASKRAVVNCLV